jgi:hypothetical protein
MLVRDVDRGQMTEVTTAEAAAGMMRYARSLGPGSAACGEWERAAVELRSEGGEVSTEDSGTPRTIIYTRVAREQDSPETSEAQRAAVEAYAAAHGYEVVEPYRDEETATATIRTVPEQGTHQIVMTGQGPALRTVEILTDAGIIRVNTNLVNVRTVQPSVVVEVEPNMARISRAHTEAGGDWDVEVTHHGTRTDLTLTRRKG